MNKTLLFIALFIFSIALPAQVVEKSMSMSSGEQNGLEVDLKADSKTSEKIWKEYTKPYGKSDWDRKNKEYVLYNVHVPSISSEAVTIVVRFNQYQDMTKGSFWIKSDAGFLSSEKNGEELRGAGEFLQEYAYEVQRNAIREEIKNQEKELNSLEKDLDKLTKKNKNLHSDIEKAKEEIAKKEREIEENLESQTGKKSEIKGQKEKIQKTTIQLTKVGKNM